MPSPFGGMRRPSGKYEKPKNVKGTLKRLWSYLLKYKWHLFGALFLNIIANGCALAGPTLSGKAIDAIKLGEGNVDFQKVFYYASLMLIFYIGSGFLSFLIQLLMIRLGKNVVYDMRKDVFDKIAELPISYFDNHPIGDIISKISYDVDTINTSLSSDFVTMCSSIITVLGSLCFMLYISPKLVLIFCVTVPLSFLYTKMMLKKTKPLYRERSNMLGKLNGYSEEMITGYKTIQSFSKEEYVVEKYKDINKKATKATYRADYYGAMTGPGVNFFNNISLSLICMFGAILNIRNGFSYGSIASFIQYSRKFSGPINETANIFTDLQSALAASERVFGLLDERVEEKNQNKEIVKNLKGHIVFENVSFGYEKNKVILHSLNLDVKPGDLIAIVGPTGAGKTTIINLLLHFYPINDGTIWIDDKDIEHINIESLRKSFALVLQDAWLLNDTILENVRYGNPNATEEMVIKACQMAHIHDSIMNLPEGYKTRLSANGTNISKGQKQLLTIARAMLMDANILILDEATSNVDTRTEMQIQDAMKQLMKHKTCFIIAHRLSTIQTASTIVVLRNGNVIEQGNHQELLLKKGFYSELFCSQFK